MPDGNCKQRVEPVRLEFKHGRVALEFAGAPKSPLAAVAQEAAVDGN